MNNPNITSSFCAAVSKQCIAMRSYDKLAEEQLRIRNTLYGKIVSEEVATINKLTCELETALNADYKFPHFKCSSDNGRSKYIIIYYTQFNGNFRSEIERDIASIALLENKISFRKNGATMVTRVNKYRKDLTVEKIVKAINKWALNFSDATDGKINNSIRNNKYLKIGHK